MNYLPKVIVRIDKRLNKYSDEILFPKKVKAAKETMKKTGLPKNMNDFQYICY